MKALLAAVGVLSLLLLSAAAQEAKAPDYEHRIQLLEQRVAELESRLGTWDKPELAPEKEKALAAHPGKAMFESLCMACHKAQPSPPMLAPPVFAMKDHYLRAYPGKDEFVDAVAKWAKAPDKEKSLMPGALKKFGLMAALPLPDEQLRQIADYLYQNEFAKPGWYDRHYRAEHGNKKPNK